jgi:hypothetical protein
LLVKWIRNEVSPDRHFGVRRKNFYMRHGCPTAANLDYRMPLVGRNAADHGLAAVLAGA